MTAIALTVESTTHAARAMRADGPLMQHQPAASSMAHRFD
jgi:hypothetical protein